MQTAVAFIASACFEKEVSTASVFMFTIQRNLLFKAIVCSRKKRACYINLRVSQRTASCDLSLKPHGTFGAAKSKLDGRIAKMLAASPLKARLHSAAPVQHASGPPITSLQILQVGLSLMDQSVPKDSTTSRYPKRFRIETDS